MKPFELGVNFVGVNGSGAKYKPFLILAKDLDIPVFIFSDGETKIVKELKKNYDKIFGETDVEKSSNITILEGTDFEGYLLNNGFKNLIEDSINEVDGEGFIEQWITNKNGTALKQVRTNNPPCTTCNQPIFQSPLRDYNGEEGRGRAIQDILDSSKPKYAMAIAEQFTKLPKESFPEKIVQFFQQIESGV